MRDKDAHLIFEKYATILKEEFKFDEDRATIDFKSKEPEQSMLSDYFNRLSVQARDPWAYIKSFLGGQFLLRKSIFSGFLKAMEFFKSGENAKAIIEIKDFCQNLLNESKKSVEVVKNIVNTAKEIGKSLDDASKFLNVEIKKIIENLKLIYKQKDILNNILEKEWERVVSGKEDIKTPKPNFEGYIENFFNYLVEKGITSNPPKNIESIPFVFENYINKSFNIKTEPKPSATNRGVKIKPEELEGF